MPKTIDLRNCYIFATEQNYQLLIDLGYTREYGNVKENGISWKGCYVIKEDGTITAQGSWEYAYYLKFNEKYKEVIFEDKTWYKIPNPVKLEVA